MKTIILGNAPINNGNRGCVALTYCSIYLLERVLGHGNYHLYLTESFQEEGIHTISFMDETVDYDSLYVPDFNSLKGIVKSLFQIKRTWNYIKVIKSADYILDIGQGDSFSDIYGKKRFDSIDGIHKVARFFSKPYVFLPQTIGPFKDPLVKSQACKSMREAAFVMARDKQSFDYVLQNVPTQKNVKEYIDVAFFLPYKKRVFCKGYIHVGLNVSALLWNGGYTGNNQFDLKSDYQETIRGIINYFLSQSDVMLHLVPHVVVQERHVENDYAVSFDLCEEYGSDRLVLAPFFLSPVDAKSYIAGLDFFMGARMHSTIAAFSSGVPVVPMAYSRKFNGLFIETLQYNIIVDLKEMDKHEVLDTITDAYKNHVCLRDVVNDRMNGFVKVREEMLLDDLKKIMEV